MGWPAKLPDPSIPSYKLNTHIRSFHRLSIYQVFESYRISQLNQFVIFSTTSIIPSFFGGRRSNVFDPFSVDIWDPFDGFPFNASLNSTIPNSAARETAAITNARIDWKETPEAHVFKADLPGLNKEEVKVEVEEGRVLQISGQRSKEVEEKNDQWHRLERSSGKFLRRFRLPENTNVDQVKAAMENGVLTVTVPKTEVNKSDVKAIDISG